MVSSGAKRWWGCRGLRSAYGPGSQADMIRALAHCVEHTMNRRKKLNQILRTNAKKASAKLAPASKNRYVSKADRAKLAEEAGHPSTDATIAPGAEEQV